MRKISIILILLLSSYTSAQEKSVNPLTAEEAIFPQVPYVFKDGDVAEAEDMNENFDYISDRLAANNILTVANSDLILSLVEYLGDRLLETKVYYSYLNSNEENWYVSQLATANCPVDSIITGGGINCFGDDTDFDTTNGGTVASSAPVGNGWSGFCVADPLGTDSEKLGPGITAYATCLSLTGFETVDALKVGETKSDNLTASKTPVLSTAPLTQEGEIALKEIKVMHQSYIEKANKYVE